MDQDIVATPPPPALTFTATRGAFLKLLLVNALLTILTLGIYRFWAKTKVRRYLWSHIRFLDDPLEYTGTAGELFLGFLIVLAVLFPLGFVYTTIQTLVPPDSGWVHVALEVIYYLVLFALIQIGFYRAWRYRMSRTRWRGIRFGLDGSSWTYLKLASGWTLLTAVTLGVAYPWMQVELWRYQMRHTHIGQETFAFNGKGRDLLPDWLWVNIPLTTGIAILFVTPIVIGATEFSTESTVLTLLRGDDPEAWLLLIGAIALICVAAIMFFAFNIIVTRYQVSHLHTGSTSITSSLPIWPLFISAVLALVVVLGLFFLGTTMTAFATAMVAHSVETEQLIGIISGVVIALIVFPLIWAVVYQFEFLKQLALSTAVTNPGYLEAVAQRPASEMKTGEGLADALDIGGL